MKIINVKPLIIIPVGIGLIFSMLINGWSLLTGGANIHLEFLNNYNRTPFQNYPSFFTFLMYLSAILQLLAALLLAVSFIKREFLGAKNALFFKWGVFFAILAVTIYGFMVRIMSNHGAAATLFFYVGLLYFCLWFVEKKKENLNTGLFRKIKIIPIYATLFYTMGFPGWQKLVNSAEVMGNYGKLFSNSFLSKMPGGIEPFIYFLGFLEILVPILLIISLSKKEFLLDKHPLILDLSLLVCVTTFIMLCFGLSVVLNYPGATNLIFYGLFTLAFYSYINDAKTSICNIE